MHSPSTLPIAPRMPRRHRASPAAPSARETISLGMSESTLDQRMTPRLAPVAFVDLTVPRATEGGMSAKEGKAIEDKGKGMRRRNRTLTEKEGAVVGAEAGERASVGMASSGASAESAGARGKRQAGRGGDGRSRRRRGGRRGPGRHSRGRNASITRMTDLRVSAWTAGAAASARTGSGGLGARTAGAPPSASTTESGAHARTAGAPPSASTSDGGTSARTAGAPPSASTTE